MVKKNKMLNQMEFFDLISSKNLSPNQYYLLCSISTSVSPLYINLHLEARSLKKEGWLTSDNKLTLKSIELINELERLFSLKKKLTSKKLMGADYKENIVKYNELYPNIKLGSGKPARSAVGNLDKNFRWFFQNHKYSWETIFNVTINYINHNQKKNYKYCRTSQFFIKKNDLSDLADLCEAHVTGGDEELKRLHSVKVV